MSIHRRAIGCGAGQSKSQALPLRAFIQFYLSLLTICKSGHLQAGSRQWAAPLGTSGLTGDSVAKLRRFKMPRQCNRGHSANEGQLPRSDQVIDLIRSQRGSFSEGSLSADDRNEP